MGTAATLTDLVYGDWEWDTAANRPGNTYAAQITGRWGGGVEFRTDKATAERIVATQTKLRDEGPYGDDIEALAWDGDTLVLTDLDGTEYRNEPDADGMYHCGFGWTWAKWTEEA